MTDDDRVKLLFGPYVAPEWHGDEPLDCEYRGRAVRVAGLTDGPIPWPYGRGMGRRSPIVCGDLARAVRCEDDLAVASHWGVAPRTVQRWRAAIGTRRTARPRSPGENLEGRVVGRLVVVGRASPGKWRCRCECGAEVLATTGHLTRPHATRSCGCLRNERVAEMGRHPEDRPHGDGHYLAKLTAPIVRRAIGMRADGATYAEIIERLGLAVRVQTLAAAVAGKTWRLIDRAPIGGDLS